jgi:predicted HicB family RNase H-like nuclease
MNITLAIDERLVARARRVAASLGKSLNQLIRDHLEAITSQDSAETFALELRRLSTEAHGNSGGRRFNRDEAHGRP